MAFQQKHGSTGCLLIHGFTGSPNELADLGDFLRSQDLTVSMPTLPGHGTQPTDLFKVTWQDWFECVREGYTELRGECDEVFVCGLSMGGALALLLASQEDVDGVMVLSAPVDFPRWQKLAARYLQRVLKYRHKSDGEDVRDASAKPKLRSYQVYPIYAVDQLFRLVDVARDCLPHITQPILIMHSRKDHTVAFSNSGVIFEQVGSHDKRKIDLDESYHVITVDVEREQVQRGVLEFIKSHSKKFES